MKLSSFFISLYLYLFCILFLLIYERVSSLALLFSIKSNGYIFYENGLLNIEVGLLVNPLFSDFLLKSVFIAMLGLLFYEATSILVFYLEKVTDGFLILKSDLMSSLSLSYLSLFIFEFKFYQ